MQSKSESDPYLFSLYSVLLKFPEEHLFKKSDNTVSCCWFQIRFCFFSTCLGAEIFQQFYGHPPDPRRFDSTDLAVYLSCHMVTALRRKIYAMSIKKATAVYGRCRVSPSCDHLLKLPASTTFWASGAKTLKITRFVFSAIIFFLLHMIDFSSEQYCNRLCRKHQVGAPRIWE